MTPRLLLPPLLAVTLALAACGSGGGSKASTSAAATTPADAKSLDADRAKDAVGAVSVCGAITDTRALLPELRKIDAASDRLQISTLGFPDGGDGALDAFLGLQRRESKDCDVFLARGPAAMTALVGSGSLFDLAPALKDLVGPGGAPLRPVQDDGRSFGLPLVGAKVPGVVVVSVNGRNPGGALEVAEDLGGARKPAKK